ncbi:MAG: type II toxin-antitoxin system RelE/ParE family toxin [Elusimicrobia bacterium]|nr:type II toxin-antitoxin system RelE/ParE family toxin [Elusimicrobiota bacterium]
MSWRVKLSPAAARSLSAIREPNRSRIGRLLASLESHSRPFGIKRLGGGMHRVRAGDWRVIYEISDAELTVRIARIVRRNERTYDFL